MCSFPDAGLGVTGLSLLKVTNNNRVQSNKINKIFSIENLKAFLTLKVPKGMLQVRTPEPITRDGHKFNKSASEIYFRGCQSK